MKRCCAPSPRWVGGSAVYGVGWGLTGFCVGPAVAALAFADGRVVVYLAALVAGMLLSKLIDAALSKRTGPARLSESP